MVNVFLGLGSNLGNREQNIKRAIQLLAKKHIRVLVSSAIIETNPEGGPPQNKYLNAVIEAETFEEPQQLLKITQSIEKQLGRKKTVRNGPRTIDIDILLYGSLAVKSTKLTIPHPRMLKRDFVMTPLKKIAPEIVKDLAYASNPVY